MIMSDKIFLGTVWKNKYTWGLRVGKYRDIFFSKDIRKIELKLGNKIIEKELTDAFWHDCPEIRGQEIKDWLLSHNKERGKILFKVLRPYRTFQVFNLEE